MICFRTLSRAAICLVVLLSLPGCGRRGPLEPPPGSSNALPLSGVPDATALPKNEAGLPSDAAPGYPLLKPTGGSAEAAAATEPATPAAAPANPPATAPKAPPRPFPLDPLL